jgi:hypothetical protein
MTRTKNYVALTKQMYWKPVYGETVQAMEKTIQKSL